MNIPKVSLYGWFVPNRDSKDVLYYKTDGLLVLVNYITYDNTITPYLKDNNAVFNGELAKIYCVNSASECTLK